MQKLLSLLLIIVLALSLVACEGGACESIELNKYEVTLTEEGDTFGLKVSTDPKDTSDDVEFESSDEDVATVNSRGLITAVGSGHATITVICGDETEFCEVECDFGGTSRNDDDNGNQTNYDDDHDDDNDNRDNNKDDPVDDNQEEPTEKPTSSSENNQTEPAEPQDNVLIAYIDGKEYLFELDYAQVKQDLDQNRKRFDYIQAHYYAYNPRGEVIYELYLNFASNLTCGTYDVMGDRYALDLGFGIRKNNEDILYDTNRKRETVVGYFTISDMSSDWNTYTGYFNGALENEDNPGTIDLVVTYFNFTLYS